ncbi:sigma-70 family RNA polymerase sigma factor [Streptomyces sp. NPDC051907]|uniref:RNA polymerase sigma factor n=1 Tax=Streptomyces sp. NPDC051907 TaxID=3155284 RepID=UPI00341CB563
MEDPGDSRSTQRRLEGLFTAHADRVYAFAAHRLDPEAARDVVSETFLAAWRRIEDVRDPALPWLLGTARKIIANELRRHSRQTALTERLIVMTAERATDDESVSAADRQSVIAAMRRLSEADQEVLAVSAWYDLSGPEAAKVLGCSPGAYAVRLHRARRRLHRQMGRAAAGDCASRPVQEVEQ